MPRHSFSFPPEVREAVRRHIANAVASVDLARFNQEPSYTAALAHALEGIAYRGPHGSVEFRSTVINDHGRNAAERWSGADLAITADISDDSKQVRKAILVQVKRSSINELSSKEVERLRGQIEDMKNLTKSPKLMDIQNTSLDADPGIYSANTFASGEPAKRYRLADYFVQRVLTTMDGDTRPTFVQGVQDSGLTQLKVIAKKGD